MATNQPKKTLADVVKDAQDSVQKSVDNAGGPIEKARQMHEDAINTQKRALRESSDPNAHARATVASQNAATASSDAHADEMKRRFEQTQRQNQSMTGKNYNAGDTSSGASLNPFRNWANINKAVSGR